jgi:uncharacterized RDD family membrane protein YckC
MVQQQTAVRYASWIRRVGASLVDNLVPLVPLAVVALWVTARQESGPANGVEVVLVNGIALSSVGLAVYNRWIRTGRTGQSWGKQALGIRLVDDGTGRPIGGLRAFGRELAHLADAVICSIGYLLPLWDPKRQTLADKIAGSVVVQD